jgi:hypothetical protein
MIDQDAIDAVLPSRPTQPVVWYYTSPDTANAILAGGSFWATAMAGLNDRSELTYGMDLVNEVWSEVSETSDFWPRIDAWMYLAELQLRGERVSDSYVLCASARSDWLTQIDRYGECQLGIEVNAPMTKVPASFASGGRVAPTFTTGWRPVIYDSCEQNEHIRRLLEVLEDLCLRAQLFDAPTDLGDVDLTGIECILRSVVYLKDPSFEEEQEVRLYGQAKATGAMVSSHAGRFGPSTHIYVRSAPIDRAGNDLPVVLVKLADVNEKTADRVKMLRKTIAALGSALTVEVVPSALRK